MNLPPHRMVPPVESRKRKEREILHYNNNRTTTEVTTKPKPSAPLSTVSANERAEPPINNRLLAGCMAYEFLTKGTLLGNMYNPARTEVAAAAGAKLLEPRGVKDLEQYGEIARILKTEGTYIPSIVNPAQLARWIQM